MPTVTVVLAAYTEDRWDHLQRAVSSALAQQPPPEQVVLAVDGNQRLHDRAVAAFPGVEVVLNTGLPGASGTRNAGAAVARGDVLLFLDDDACAEAGWLAALTGALEGGAHAGAGGRVVPEWPLGRRPPWFPPTFDWAVGATYEGMPVRRAPVRNVWALNMALPRAAFDAVGGFDPTFGKTGDRSRPEDTELCVRVSAASGGRPWLYVPEAVVRHAVPSSRTTLGYFARRCWHEGRGKHELRGLTARTPANVLAVERQYVLRTLPRTVARDLRGGPRGVARAAAAVLGLLIAAAGWAAGAVAGRST